MATAKTETSKTETKAKAAANGNGVHGANGADAAKATMDGFMNMGTDAFKDTFERVQQSYDDAASFSKGNVDAVVESITLASEGAEKINAEVMAYGRDTLEDAAHVAKSMMGLKSANDLFEMQSAFARTAFDTYMERMNKLSEMMVETSRKASEPMNARMTAFVEVMQPRRG